MKKNKPSQPPPDPQLPLNESELALADLFLASLRQDLSSIEQALDRRDYHAIQRTVHSLKGAAMIFRASATANAALYIETVLYTGMPVDHAQLSAACAALRRQIESL